MIPAETVRRRAALVVVLGLASLGAACSGGGGSSPTPAPTNHAPGFSSAATASVAENVTGAIYTAAASDPDGDAVTFTIAGGADATAFTLAGGALSFVAPPNFERPTDANADNVYEVALNASDGRGGTATLSLSVQVTNDHEGVNLDRIASGFGADAVIAARARKSGVIVVSQDGVVHEVDAVGGATNDVGNVFKAGETGRVLAVADFNFYGVVMLDVAGRGVIVRTVPMPDSPLHYAIEADLAVASTMKPRGVLFRGGDGFLFGALGDPSGDFAQDAASGYGKFYRVQVDPYCGASTLTYCISAELFGDGVHAPAGGGGYAGMSFLLDRGTDQQEEISYFNQNARPIDFGWPYREGTYVRVANPPAIVIGPSITYGYGDGAYAGKGMTGSLAYTGSNASLTGKIVVTDESGKVFTFPQAFLADGILHRSSEMENRTADFTPASRVIERPVGIVQDYSGRLLVLDGDGELFATN